MTRSQASTLSRLVVALMVTVLVSSMASTSEPVRADGAEWAVLGPFGPGRVVALAPAPDWPADPLILAARTVYPGARPPFGGGLVRSRDAGRTWETVPNPVEPLNAPQLSDLRIVAIPGGHAVFAILKPPVDQPGPWHLWRSTDECETWELTFEGDRELVLSASPDSAHDGLIFVSADGQLRRSHDGGQSWESLDPAPGQSVNTIAASPDFAHDRTVFIAAVSGELSTYGQVRSEGLYEPLDLNVRSAGILVSHDGGDTWTPSNTGLGIEEVPYRNVQALAISPTFARDGTLFATALGPYRLEWRPYIHNGGFPEDQARLPWPAVFRSQDRGQTWQRVAENANETTFAFSPTFADDGVIMRAQSGRDFTPGSQTCSVWRSGDAGTTWIRVRQPGQYEWCHGLFLTGGAPDGPGALKVVERWMFSDDDGLTWGADWDRQRQGRQPDSVHTVVPVVTTSGPPAFLVGADFGGVWLRGQDVTSTDGMLPCTSVPGEHFRHLYEADHYIRMRLGCAIGVEEPVHVQMGNAITRGGTPQLLMMLDRPPLRWLAVPGHWSYTYDQKPPDLVEQVDGVLQIFDGGLMLDAPRGEGTDPIHVLGGWVSGDRDHNDTWYRSSPD